ncbi:MAG: dihydrofolate reductase family protein [Terriglobia bacterium]|jgi:dihydrofolate reductase|nr:dihydrofolate reductase family protein [Terriglobia bacterium]
MRKVRYSVAASLDGYIAASNGSVDWLNRFREDVPGEDFGMTAFFKTVDTVLMGRKTYEIALKMGMEKSGMPGLANYVFSRTLPAGQRDGVTFVADGVGDLLAGLKKKPGKDIWLCGGGELAREALREGALDEIRVAVIPILIGSGIQTFATGFPETKLRLLECKQYKGGVTELVYAAGNKER